MVTAMRDASEDHELVAGNLAVALGNHLRGKSALHAANGKSA